MEKDQALKFPGGKGLQQGIGGQVQLDGRDGYVPASQRADIGAFFRVTGGGGPADPIVRFTARVFTSD